MADRKRDKEKTRERDSRDHRDRDRDRDRDQDRVRDRDRERDRDRRKRSRSPDQHRRRSPSQERRRSRSRSVDRYNRRHAHKPRSSSPDAHRRKRRRDGSDDDREFRRSKGPDANSGDGAAKDLKKVDIQVGGGDAAMEVAEVDSEEIEMMKVMGIPVGFDSTKGKHVSGADVSAVRSVTKRQPRQYMNRRGGFNRPLPPERNR